MRSTKRALAVMALLSASVTAGPAAATTGPDPAWTPPPGSALAESLKDLPEDERLRILRDQVDLAPVPSSSSYPSPTSSRCNGHTCLSFRLSGSPALGGLLPSEWVRCVGEVGPASSWVALQRWFTTAACLGDVLTEDASPR